jgi:hypothetical protein
MYELHPQFDTPPDDTVIWRYPERASGSEATPAWEVSIPLALPRFHRVTDFRAARGSTRKPPEERHRDIASSLSPSSNRFRSWVTGTSLSANYSYHLNVGAQIREASARLRSSRLHVSLTKNARTCVSDKIILRVAENGSVAASFI